MKSGILSKSNVVAIANQLEAYGYDVVSKDKINYRIFDEGEEIFTALVHSSGKNYLCRWDTDKFEFDLPV